MNYKERSVIIMEYGIGDTVLLGNGKTYKIVKIFSYQTEVENGKFIDNDYIINNLIENYKDSDYTDEKFTVQDDHYGMYVIGKDTLSYDKSKAYIFNSREEANETAADLHLNTWEVLPYDA